MSLNEHVARRDDGVLAVNGLPLADLAAQYGTPLFVYSLPCVRARLRSCRDAFESRMPEESVGVRFSFKANRCKAVIRALLQEGAGVDCVSGGEVYLALEYGCPPDRIVFAGVGKTPEDIDFAVSRGVGWFNVENELEVQHISDSAQRHGVTQRVALRLNPHVMADTFANIATGHDAAKFGLGAADVNRLLGSAAAYPGVAMAGVHVHIGSQLATVDPTADAVRAAIAVAAPHSGITHINVGGGFAARYDAADHAKPLPDEFAAAVCPLVAGRYQLLLEPGRFVAAESGVLATRVLYRKQLGPSPVVIVDASMVEVLRPALYGAKHEVLPTVAGVAESTVVDVVGPVCESTDVIARQVSLPSDNEYLAVMTVGAYCSTMAGNYNARPLSAEVVVDERDGAFVAALSRRRQSWSDLAALDV